MKRTLTYISLLLFVGLWPSLTIRAELVTHDFHADYGTTVIYSSGNKVATTDLITYTCSGTNAQFYLDLTYGTTIALNLPSSTSKAVTDPAITRLNRIQLQHYPDNAKCENLKIDVSTDGSTWVDKSGDATYSKGGVDLPLATGDYYVRFRNTTSSGVSILRIMYYIGPCHCLRVVSE